MIEPLEVEIWKKLPSDLPINYEKHVKDLKTLNISQMSSLSQRLIRLSEDEREAFIRDNMEPKLERLPVIVAMTTIYKSIEEEKSPNCLIIATEASDILIMDAQSFNLLHQARVCNSKATPDLISASGSYQSDFKVVIATREGSLCILRKNWLEGREIVKLAAPATAMCLLPIDQTIVVLSNSLMCYSKKGKMLWSMAMPEPVLCMAPVALPHLGVSLVKRVKIQSRLLYCSKSCRFVLDLKVVSCRFTRKRLSLINFTQPVCSFLAWIKRFLLII